MSKRTVVVEIDPDEVALIIAETCIGLRRPAGRTAASLLAEMGQEQPKIVRDMRLAASRVLQHVHDRFNAGRSALQSQGENDVG